MSKLETKKPLSIQDRTSIEVDWTCEMMYYWNRLHGGKGITPATEAHYFVDGRTLHDDLQQFAEGKPTFEILDSLPSYESCEGDQIKLEKLARRKGWIRAYSTIVWPYLMERFEVVHVEQEIILDRGSLWIPVKPDLVLRHKKTHKLIYIEYKTTGSVRPNFALHWPFAAQLHLGITALEEELNETVAYAHVLGLYKGTEQKGKLRHPYVWAYSDIEHNLWYPEWKSGWDLRGVWEYGDLWPRTLGGNVTHEKVLEVMNNQFVWSEPVFKDKRMVDNLVVRRTMRGGELEQIKGWLNNPGFVPEHHFNQCTTQCQPVVGSPCAYKDACWNAVVHDDPIGSGLYVERIPHHDIELVTLEDADE